MGSNKSNTKKEAARNLLLQLRATDQNAPVAPPLTATDAAIAQTYLDEYAVIVDAENVAQRAIEVSAQKASDKRAKLRAKEVAPPAPSKPLTTDEQRAADVAAKNVRDQQWENNVSFINSLSTGKEKGFASMDEYHTKKKSYLDRIRAKRSTQRVGERSSKWLTFLGMYNRAKPAFWSIGFIVFVAYSLSTGLFFGDKPTSSVFQSDPTSVAQRQTTIAVTAEARRFNSMKPEEKTAAALSTATVIDSTPTPTQPAPLAGIQPTIQDPMIVLQIDDPSKPPASTPMARTSGLPTGGAGFDLTSMITTGLYSLSFLFMMLWAVKRVMRKAKKKQGDVFDAPAPEIQGHE